MRIFAYAVMVAISSFYLQTPLLESVFIFKTNLRPSLSFVFKLWVSSPCVFNLKFNFYLPLHYNVDTRYSVRFYSFFHGN